MINLYLKLPLSEHGCKKNVKWFVFMVFPRIRVNKKRKNTIHILTNRSVRVRNHANN